MLIVVCCVIIILFVHIRVQRLKAAGHIQAKASGTEILWSVFLLPLLRILWAGLYEMIRTAARGTRQKPPLGPFLIAWVTGQTQTVTRMVIITVTHGVRRQIRVSEQVKPPRPPGRPRKYPEGWRKARLTGRPRGRPRKGAQALGEGAGHGDS